ncbi:MAG: DUF2059 domain-containing protein [Candidatus Omnitrophica bacterium]|nr:DUF2059 domain-containing protein [Candidatus Omnitrophota bacterium]
MFWKRFNIVTVASFLILSLFVVESNAQEEIPPEKKALIEKIIFTTKSVASRDQFKQGLVNRIISDRLLQAGISRDKQEQIQKEILEKIPPLTVDQAIEEAYYLVYNKFFDENELKVLVEFYTSSTGQKAIQLGDKVTDALMLGMHQSLSLKITPLIDSLLQEKE